MGLFCLGVLSLWTHIYIFGAVGSLYLTLLLLQHWQEKREWKVFKEKRALMNECLCDLLCYWEHPAQYPMDTYKEKLQQLLDWSRNRRDRDLLVQLMLEAHLLVLAPQQRQLERLYHDLGLQFMALRRLKRWNRDTVCCAIAELTQMREPLAYGPIVAKINHRCGTIRKQAAIATVVLRDKGIEVVLSSSQYSIDSEEQQQMVMALGQKPNYVPPQFAEWVPSKNPSVQQLTLRLIAHFGQTKAAAEVLTVLAHQKGKVWETALHTAQQLDVPLGKELLGTHFFRFSKKQKGMLLDVLLKNGSISDVARLESLLPLEKDVEVSLSMAEVMTHLACRELQEKKTKDLFGLESKETNPIQLHKTKERIWPLTFRWHLKLSKRVRGTVQRAF